MPSPPLTGLTLWLEADVGTYTDTGGTTPAVNDGDLVALWKDQSGGGFDVSQATSGNRPVLKLAIQNSKPVLRFTAASVHWMATAVTVTHNIGTGDFWMGCVVKADHSNAVYSAVLSNGNFSPGFYHPSTVGPVDSMYFGGNKAFNTTILINTFYLVELVRVSGTLKCYISSGGSIPTQEATTYSVSTSVANAAMEVGTEQAGGGASQFGGDIAEILFYNTSLNATDQTTLETYLRNKYWLLTPTPLFAPEIHAGPAMRGAAWLARLPVAEAGNLLIGPHAPPVTQSPKVWDYEIFAGPPNRMAPYLRRLPIAEAGNLENHPPPIPAVQLPPNQPFDLEFGQGPPMRGSPLLRHLEPVEAGNLYQAPTIPTPVTIDIEVHGGPAMRGAPWLQRLPTQEINIGSVRAAPATGQVRPGAGKARPFIERLPDVSDERRLARITERLSAMINSLVGQGIVQQTGQTSFAIRGGGFTMARPPTAADDIAAGATLNCLWVDTAGQAAYICVSNVAGNAVWKRITA